MAKVPSSKSSAGSPSPAAPRLTDAQIDKAIAEIPEWSHVGDTIQRTYAFTNFVESMTFVGKVAREAESAQHHPDIMIRYNKVTLTLSTHDSGGITIKDFTLAKKADGLVR